MRSAALLLCTCSASADYFALPTLVSVVSDSPAELAAAILLQAELGLANVTVTLTDPASARGKPQIAIGYGAAIAAGVPAADLDSLPRNDSFIVRSLNTSSLALSGFQNSADYTGLASGSQLAVARLLQELGFEHLAPDATVVPETPLRVSANLGLNITPAFEFRQTFSHSARSNKQWAGLAGFNDQKSAEPPGGVHTVNNLMAGKKWNYNHDSCERQGDGPCTDMLEAHPEWFWPKNKPSVTSQLCWTAPGLTEYLIEAVHDILNAQPDASIISISQNDNTNKCETKEELAVVAEEGGAHMGPMLRVLNIIADSIKDDFPNVAIQTLAYQYTRAAPSKTVPLPNVIIRLCSMEANFGVPFSDPSNAAFGKDVEAWGKISNRTYIWDYVTNFYGYIQPFPNWYVLGPNIQYMYKHGVRGLMEEGAYNTPGSDMEHLKDYVIGRMLLDPSLDHMKLIDTFLKGYYGAGAPFVKQYMDTFYQEVIDMGFYLGCVDKLTSPHGTGSVHARFLTPKNVIIAADALNKGLAAVAGTPYEARVRAVKTAVQYVVLLRWREVSLFHTLHQTSWPFAETKAAEFQEWNATVQAVGINRVEEQRCDMKCFEERSLWERGSLRTRFEYLKWILV